MTRAAMRNPLEILREGLADRYRLGPEIGRGGMAVVHLADDLAAQRRVAIKVFRPEVAIAVGPTRFLREIDIASGLEHPGIVPILGSGEINGVLFLVMPFVSGGTLRQLIDRDTQLTVPETTRLAGQVAAGLACAHAQRVVHRDIKPENILLEHGRAMITDFGVARIVSSVDEATRSTVGLMVGTPQYMSPEQLSGLCGIDARSDIYSLGCVLYEMLAGEAPFDGPTPLAIAARHLTEPPPVLTIVRPDIGAGIQAAIEKALAKIPVDRYQHVLEVPAALQAASNEG